MWLASRLALGLDFANLLVKFGEARAPVQAQVHLGVHYQGAGVGAGASASTAVQ